MITDGFEVAINGKPVVIPDAQILELYLDEYDALRTIGEDNQAIRPNSPPSSARPSPARRRDRSTIEDLYDRSTQ